MKAALAACALLVGIPTVASADCFQFSNAVVCRDYGPSPFVVPDDEG